MQCTCPSYNNANNIHSLNRRRNNKAGGVKWYSSQTLPNPKRKHNSSSGTRACNCDSSSCVFSTPRNVIDPRSGNPVKSCLNISSTSAAAAAANTLCSRGATAALAAAAASRGGSNCYLCSRSNSLRLSQDQRDRRFRRRSETQRGDGPYVVSNSDFVTPHLQNAVNVTP